MPAENSQFAMRLPQPWSRSGSYVAPGREVPKAAFAIAPHSPLAVGLRRLQSGAKLRLASAQDRVVAVTSVLSGLGSTASGEPAASFCRYRFRLTLIAVFPLPKTS